MHVAILSNNNFVGIGIVAMRLSNKFAPRSKKRATCKIIHHDMQTAIQTTQKANKKGILIS